MAVTEKLPLSTIAKGLRETLLQRADRDALERACNPIINRMLDELNEAGLNVATSLVARALIGRAIIQIAGSWLGDFTDAPEPECHAAIRSIVDDPPPDMAEEMTSDGKPI